MQARQRRSPQRDFIQSADPPPPEAASPCDPSFRQALPPAPTENTPAYRSVANPLVVFEFAQPEQQVLPVASIQDPPSSLVLADNSFYLHHRYRPPPLVRPTPGLSFDLFRPSAHRRCLTPLHFHPPLSYQPLMEPNLDPPQLLRPPLSRFVSKVRSLMKVLSCCNPSSLPPLPPPNLMPVKFALPSNVGYDEFELNSGLTPVPRQEDFLTQTAISLHPPPPVVECQVCGTSHSLMPPHPAKDPLGVGLLSTCGCNIFIHRGGGCNRRFVVARMRASQVLEDGGSFSMFSGMDYQVCAHDDYESESLGGGFELCSGGARIFECVARCGDTVRMEAVAYF